MIARVLAVIALATATASADPDCAALVDRAQASHAAGKYREALTELDRAYACQPDPSLLFSMGQAAYNLDDYAAAEDYYLRYLKTNPPEDDAIVAGQALVAARERRTQRAKVVRVVEPADKLAWGLAITGGAAIVTGGGLYLFARHQIGDRSGNYDDYEARLARAPALRTAGIACIAGGSVVLGLAIWRWVARRDRTPRDVALVPSTNGFTLIGRL